MKTKKTSNVSRRIPVYSLQILHCHSKKKKTFAIELNAKKKNGVIVKFFRQAASEIESLKVELAKSAAEMTAQRDNTAKELSDMKAKYAAVVQGRILVTFLIS